tara:strand:- start:161 stop:1189 length:1029 start_codon:yes stop_codon:yes gene_type:complete
MANNKYAGYTPKKDENTGTGNRLDRVNPYEFRMGMDYELTAVGCSRLSESTIEEREKATESVLKNLDTHGGYYTSLITYETTFRNSAGKKPTFKSWLAEQDEVKMIETDKTYKNDKMSEPKIESQEVSTKADIKQKALKEAIKDRIRKTLLEKKKDADVDEMDDDELDVKAGKGAKKGNKKISKFDDEREAIEKLLEDIKEVKDKKLEAYKKSKKDKKAVDNYKESIKLSEKEIAKYKKIAEKYDVDTKDYTGDEKDIPSTIKALEKRLKAIDKDEEEAVAKLREDKKEIALTDMTREEQIRLLNIIKENGISLKEGSGGVKVYYEIAKSSFLEGLYKGLKL